jgi:hypothetical protein
MLLCRIAASAGHPNRYPTPPLARRGHLGEATLSVYPNCSERCGRADEIYDRFRLNGVLIGAVSEPLNHPWP